MLLSFPLFRFPATWIIHLLELECCHLFVLFTPLPSLLTSFVFLLALLWKVHQFVLRVHFFSNVNLVFVIINGIFSFKLSCSCFVFHMSGTIVSLSIVLSTCLLFQFPTPEADPMTRRSRWAMRCDWLTHWVTETKSQVENMTLQILQMIPSEVVEKSGVVFIPLYLSGHLQFLASIQGQFPRNYRLTTPLACRFLQPEEITPKISRCWP